MDESKQVFWQGFLKRAGLTNHVHVVSFPDIVQRAKAFLIPPTLAAAKGETFESHWSAGGPWA